MKKQKLKLIKITSEDKIKYVPITEKYGRAEFEFCPVFKYGKMKKIFIYPRQQEVDYYYELETNNQKQFQITSWIHKTDSPKIWIEYWCKEHKTICHRVYVPNNTDTLEFESLSVFEIRFVKGEENENNKPCS